MLCVDMLESFSSSMFCVGRQRFDEENKIVRHSRIRSRIMCIDLKELYVLIYIDFDFDSPQGTNQQQDTRFSDKEKKLLKQMKFGDCLNQRVNELSKYICILQCKRQRYF